MRFYIKLVFINIFRSLRYTIPLFTVFALTTGIVVLTDNARNAGYKLKEQIASSYVTTVEVIYSPPFLLSGNSDSSNIQELTWYDVELPASFSQVKTNSFELHADMSLPLCWEVNFDETLISEGDVIINNQSMLGNVYVYGVRNSQYLDTFELVKGRHITDEDNGRCCAVISSELAELHSLDIGDTIAFPPEQSVGLLSEKYEIVGIAEYNNRYAVYVPYYTVLEYSDTATVSNIKFVLKAPDMAADFIENALPYFDDMGYILQADDYKYKREVYPVEMMINLNSMIYIACMFTGTLLLAMIIIKSALTRMRDIDVMRFLSCQKKNIFLTFYLEKFIVMLAGITSGLAASVLLSDIGFGISINVIAFVLSLILICTALLLFIYISAVRRKLMNSAKST